jgi:hypothetical protein
VAAEAVNMWRRPGGGEDGRVEWNRNGMNQLDVGRFRE